MTKLNRGGTKIYSENEDIYSKKIVVYIYLYYSPCFICLSFFEKVLKKYTNLTMHFYYSKEYQKIDSNYQGAYNSKVLAGLPWIWRKIPSDKLKGRYKEILSNNFDLFSRNLIFHKNYEVVHQAQINKRLERGFLS